MRCEDRSKFRPDSNPHVSVVRQNILLHYPLSPLPTCDYKTQGHTVRDTQSEHTVRAHIQKHTVRDTLSKQTFRDIQSGDSVRETQSETHSQRHAVRDTQSETHSQSTQSETHSQRHTVRDTQSETRSLRHTVRATQSETRNQRHAVRETQSETRSQSTQSDAEHTARDKRAHSKPQAPSKHSQQQASTSTQLFDPRNLERINILFD